MKQVDIVFMLDTSGSMANEIEGVKNGCVEFADRIIHEESSALVRLGLVGFDIGGHRSRRSQPYIVHNLSTYTIGVWSLATPDAFKHNVSMLSLGLFGGGGCYLANHDTLDIFPHIISAFDPSGDNRKMLVIISDEIGDTSAVQLIVEQLRNASITAYVLGVPKSGQGAHEQIAQKTEGRFWDITRGKYDFNHLLDEVATTIAHAIQFERFKFVRPPFVGDSDLAYTATWNGPRPGCLIVLVDQSESMQEPFTSRQVGAGKRKCDMVATVINGLLHEFIMTNTVGTSVKERADIAVLGYEGDRVESVLGGALAMKPMVTLSELKSNPLRVETRNRKEVSDEGDVIEVPTYFPIWVDPHIGTRTPMCAALNCACELAESWATQHADSYPPVVVNVTDGASTDGDPTYFARELCKIHTRYGQALLFNCHITGLPDSTVAFPDSVASLPRDSENLAPLLFELSSVLPSAAISKLTEETGQPLPLGARAFIFNGDAAAIRQMFTFATVGARVGKADPNR